MSEKKEFSKLASIKKCPVCKGELEEGYVHAPDGIRWDTERHKGSVWRLETILPRWRVHLLGEVPSAAALRCKGCKIMVFHYGKKRES